MRRRVAPRGAVRTHQTLDEIAKQLPELSLTERAFFDEALYTFDAQALLAWLRQQLPSLARIAGHEDLDTGQVPASDDPAQRVQRKRDPGPLFPWSRVLAEGSWQRWLPHATARP